MVRISSSGDLIVDLDTPSSGDGTVDLDTPTNPAPTVFLERDGVMASTISSKGSSPPGEVYTEAFHNRIRGSGGPGRPRMRVPDDCVSSGQCEMAPPEVQKRRRCSGESQAANIRLRRKLKNKISQEAQKGRGGAGGALFLDEDPWAPVFLGMGDTPQEHAAIRLCQLHNLWRERS